MRRPKKIKSSFCNVWCGEDNVIFKSPYCVILCMFTKYNFISFNGQVCEHGSPPEQAGLPFVGNSGNLKREYRASKPETLMSPWHFGFCFTQILSHWGSRFLSFQIPSRVRLLNWLQDRQTCKFRVCLMGYSPPEPFSFKGLARLCSWQPWFQSLLISSESFKVWVFKIVVMVGIINLLGHFF